MIQEHYRSLVQAGRAVERGVEGPAPVDEIFSPLPRRVQQPLGNLAGARVVAVGNGDRRDSGVGDIGEREAAEDGGRQRALGLGLAGHGDQLAHG